MLYVFLLRYVFVCLLCCVYALTALTGRNKVLCRNSLRAWPSGYFSCSFASALTHTCPSVSIVLNNQIKQQKRQKNCCYERRKSNPIHLHCTQKISEKDVSHKRIQLKLQRFICIETKSEQEKHGLANVDEQILQVQLLALFELMNGNKQRREEAITEYICTQNIMTKL